MKTRRVTREINVGAAPEDPGALAGRQDALRRQLERQLGDADGRRQGRRGAHAPGGRAPARHGADQGGHALRRELRRREHRRLQGRGLRADVPPRGLRDPAPPRALARREDALRVAATTTRSSRRSTSRPSASCTPWASARTRRASRSRATAATCTRPTTADSNSVSVVDTTDWTATTYTVPGLDRGSGIVVYPDGKHAAVTGWCDNHVFLVGIEGTGGHPQQAQARMLGPGPRAKCTAPPTP